MILKEKLSQKERLRFIRNSSRVCIRLENIPDVVESGKCSCVGESIYISINFSIILPGENTYELKLHYFLSFLSFLDFLDLILDERNGPFGESESY